FSPPPSAARASRRSSSATSSRWKAALSRKSCERVSSCEVSAGMRASGTAAKRQGYRLHRPPPYGPAAAVCDNNRLSTSLRAVARLDQTPKTLDVLHLTHDGRGVARWPEGHSQ